MIGRHLSAMLSEEGHEVIWLSRTQGHSDPYEVVRWDVNSAQLDPAHLEGLKAVVHLAGAGVADKRWTASRKKEILESRTASTSLLVKALSNVKKKPEVFVSASGIGYYGLDTGDTVVDEASPAGDDFLANVVKHWEAASEEVASLGIRRVVVRIGVVLSDEGGALKELTAPIKWGVGAALGGGRQWMSWIHIDDLCRVFASAVDNAGFQGIINAVGPAPVTNAELTKAAAGVLKRPLWLPNVPPFVLRILVGEMAGMVLGGNKVSASRLQSVGFSYRFPELGKALKDLLAPASA